MANFQVDWKAECEHCGSKLGEEHMAEGCPDRWDFDTELCQICNEEVCKNCGAGDLHKDCKEDEEES